MCNYHFAAVDHPAADRRPSHSQQPTNSVNSCKTHNTKVECMQTETVKLQQSTRNN